MKQTLMSESIFLREYFARLDPEAQVVILAGKGCADEAAVLLGTILNTQNYLYFVFVKPLFQDQSCEGTTR